MNYWRFLLPGLCGLALVSGCNRSQTPSQAVREAVEGEAQKAKEEVKGVKGAVMRGATLRGGDAQGRPLWSLGAKEIRAEGDIAGGTPKKAVLTDAYATLFRDGKPDSTFRAATIEMAKLPSGVRLKLSGGVTGQTSGPWAGTRGPVKIAAPLAFIDVAKRILSASGGATVSQGQVTVRGQNVRAQTSLKTVDLSGGVRAHSPQGTIEAPQASWDWEKGRVKAAGGVIARRAGENTVLRGATLTADTSAQRGLISGGVTLRAPQGSGSAAQVAFDWAKNRLEARGDASLSKGDATLQAAVLTTDSRLENAEGRDVMLRRGATTLRAARAQSAGNFSTLSGSGVRVAGDGWSLQAPKATATGVGDEKTLRIVATGGVTGQSRGANFAAARATWGGGKVVGEGGVTLSKDGSQIVGNRLESDQKFQNARFSGAVKGLLAGGGTLAAPSLEKIGPKIFARRGVVATLPPNRAPGGFGTLTLRGDLWEAAADGSWAILKGNVEVRSSDGATLKAPAARYDRRKNQITAQGGVEFRDAKRGLQQRGDSLVADLTTRQVRLKNVRGSGAVSLFEGKKLFE